MINKDSKKQENKLRSLAIFQAVLVIFLSVAIGVVSKQGLDSNQSVKMAKKPAVYQAIPEGKEAYFSLSAVSVDSNNLTSGQEFEVNILLINTASLVLPEGLSSADVNLIYDTANLELLDSNTQKSGIQLQEGTIFSNYMQNNQNNPGEIWLTGYQGPGDDPYNSNGKDDASKVFATARFKVKAQTGTGQISIQGTDDNTDKTNIYANVSGYLNQDILNQSIPPNSGNLSYLIGGDGPTATPGNPTATPGNPTATPGNPTATPTENPAVCGDGVCSSSEEYFNEDETVNRWLEGTYCYEDCCENYTVEDGDLDKNCKINAADWGIMRKNWTSPGNLYYQPLQNY